MAGHAPTVHLCSCYSYNDIYMSLSTSEFIEQFVLGAKVYGVDLLSNKSYVTHIYIYIYIYIIYKSDFYGNPKIYK